MTMNKLMISLLFFAPAFCAQATTSEEARKEKTIIFTGHLGAGADIGVAGSAGIFVDPDLVIEAHVYAGTPTYDSGTNTMGSLAIRKFMSNSIYGMFGLGTRHYEKRVYDDDDGY